VIELDALRIALAAGTIGAGYFIFGISGFGAALLTVPILSHVWPVQFVLPVTALLDVTAAIFLGVKERRIAERNELKRMIPLAFIGALAGATLLVNLPREAAMASLGAVAVLYALYSLAAKGPIKPVSAAWAMPTGFIGGLSGALFGIGAPPYMIYLSRRIEDKAVLRATVATMVIFSVGSRLLFFVVAGLVMGPQLLAAAALLPFMFAGLWLGSRAHMKLSREQFARFIAVLVMATGLSLLARVLLS
jgi:uncharacterized membrane protein YfcA